MAKNTVKVKNYLNVFEEMTLTAVVIYPGYLLEETSAGLAQAHSGAGQPVFPMFALEDELQGGAITTAFAASAKVQVWTPTRGDIVYAFLADGESAVIGDFLVSDGAGKLAVYAADSAGAVEYPSSIVGVATEAVDMSGSAGEDPTGRILVKII